MATGALTEADLDRELGITVEPSATFEVGDRVLVRPLEGSLSLNQSIWRRPHLRTPGYIFGQEGIIERFLGAFPNPSLRAYGKEGSDEKLFRVRFGQMNVWNAAGLTYSGSDTDTVDVEVCVRV